MPKNVVISGAFDDLRSRDIRLLEEAAKLGSLTVLLWTDDAIRKRGGPPPKFAEAEREYVLKSIRFVSRVQMRDHTSHADPFPDIDRRRPDIWVAGSALVDPDQKAFCDGEGIEYHSIDNSQLSLFPEPASTPPTPGRRKVIVTGCFDWLHSGHVRFFEEVSGYGDLYVVVGNDANVRLLKGTPHPMHTSDERRYAAGAIRFVTQSLVSSGQGWLDAEPEIEWLRPDVYAVNEDGDQGGKREFCARHGIEYVVLKRAPKEGLPWRTSTDLRGF